MEKVPHGIQSLLFTFFQKRLLCTFLDMQSLCSNLWHQVHHTQHTSDKTYLKQGKGNQRLEVTSTGTCTHSDEAIQLTYFDRKVFLFHCQYVSLHFCCPPARHRDPLQRQWNR